MEEEITPAVVACGSEYTASITRRGQLLTWGLGSRGELGHEMPHAGEVSDGLLCAGSSPAARFDLAFKQLGCCLLCTHCDMCAPHPTACARRSTSPSVPSCPPDLS
jgi:alpha-tubulin suppressor-like RCC1 family protein